MNKELFASMREQMGPGEEVRAALAEKLAAPQKKRIPIGWYAAIAACAAVIVAAVPAYGMAQNYLAERKNWAVVKDSFGNDVVVEFTEPHSYVLADSLACWPEDAAATQNSTAAGSSDEDQGMTPGELTDNMLEAGFSQEDVDAYLASGWQMTWAKWWKFYHLSEENGARDLEALLEFSQEEGLAVSTGEEPVSEMPGGAFVSDAPDQSEAIMAYQNLMARFESDYGPGRYPDWYGGAYIDEHARLIVNIVEDCEEGRELERRIQDWAGSSRVGFGSSQLSLNQLRELQDKVVAAMEKLGLAMGCGIDEETGQVELTLPEATREALLRLAELDPEDTAILVIVGKAPGVDWVEDLALPPNTPVSNAPGAVADANDAIAWDSQW